MHSSIKKHFKKQYQLHLQTIYQEKEKQQQP
jgi:hypothetical protein